MIENQEPLTAVGPEPVQVDIGSGMSVDEYLRAAGYDMESMKAANSGGIENILNYQPPLNELTPMWIATYILLPAFVIFLITLVTTPLQDKILGEDSYKIDWTGKSGRLYQLFNAEDPLDVPPLPSAMEFGKLDEIRKARAGEGGLLGLPMEAAERAREEARLEFEAAAKSSTAPAKLSADSGQVGGSSTP